MKPDKIPSRDHVVRYIGPSFVEAGEVSRVKFQLRKGESGLSVNWLEKLGFESKDDCINEVYRVMSSGYDLNKNGWFAELQVGSIREISNNTKVNYDIEVIHKPKPADEKEGVLANISHAEIEGLPTINDDEEQAELIAGELVEICALNDLHSLSHHHI